MFLKQRDKNFDKESHKYTHFFFLTFAVHMISKSKETNLEHLRQHFFNISWSLKTSSQDWE